MTARQNIPSTETSVHTYSTCSENPFTRFASAWKWFDQSWPQIYPRVISAVGKGIVFAWTMESWVSGVTGDLLCPTGQNTAMGIPAMMGKWLLILSFQGATPEILYVVKWFQGEGGRWCGEIRLFHSYELIIAKWVTWRLKEEQKILDYYITT